MELALGSTYSSFVEFEKAFYKFMQDNDANFKVHQSKSLCNSSVTYSTETVNRLMPLKYQRLVYTCSTRGYNTPPGFVQSCKAGMEVRLERKMERLKVKRLCLEHDDSCCQVLYEYRRSNQPPRGQRKIQVIEIETDQSPSIEPSGLGFEHSHKRCASGDGNFHESGAMYREIDGIPTITEQTSSEGEYGNISDVVENNGSPTVVRRSARRRRPQPHRFDIPPRMKSNNFIKSKLTPSRNSAKSPKVIKTVPNSRRENSTPTVQSSTLLKSFANFSPVAPDSTDALFFSSLCAEVQTLPKHAKALAKLKLLQVVTEAVLEQDGHE